MTKRLYYDDSYLVRFAGRVVEQTTHEDRYAVILDRTAFYPTSGGQPFDQGILDGARVIDVLVHEESAKLLHVLDSPLSGRPDEVIGEIDWERRFDHMQQHTGQHILSQAFLQVAQAETVSFHLGNESATIDLASSKALSSSDIDPVESLSNQIVWDDRPVTSRIVRATELLDLPLRKPPAVDGDVRIVRVADFDWSACGGTHVARTGEIGLIKIIKWEKRGSETRVEFRCGQRALVDYVQKNSMINHVAAGFNVGYWELDQAVDRLVAEVKELRSQLRQAGRTLATYEADVLRQNALSANGVRVIVRNLTGVCLADMNELARLLVSQPKVVALLGVGDQKAQLCFARSRDVEIDMIPLIRESATMLGSRGGGGRPDFAQGGGSVQDGKQLDAVLDQAAQKLCTYLERAK